ncbi:MAG: C40 family peptidase [Acidobacteriota bacterium]
MKLKKIVFLAAVAFSLAAGIGGNVFAQERPRLVKTTSSRPTNQPPATSKTESTPAQLDSSSYSRPVLTTNIEVVKESQPLVKKTGMASPVEMTSAAMARSVYGSSVSDKLMKGIRDRYGIPYLYGATGPNRYDCSGFVWSVFHDAGIDFERTSARSLWEQSVPVQGDERFKFGTLVFFNSLGHIGIVADENGFYQASSSKGITYSKFEGYWEKRIIGFRRLPAMKQPAK